MLKSHTRVARSFATAVYNLNADESARIVIENHFEMNENIKKISTYLIIFNDFILEIIIAGNYAFPLDSFVFCCFCCCFSSSGKMCWRCLVIFQMFLSV